MSKIEKYLPLPRQKISIFGIKNINSKHNITSLIDG